MFWLLPFIALGLLIPFRTAEGAETNLGGEIFGPFKPIGPFKHESDSFGKDGGFDALFSTYGSLYGISPAVLKAIAIQESSLNPNAKALTSSALGLMQITKAAAQDVSESYDNQRDPKTSIRTGAKYLRLQMDQHSFTLKQAIQAYYAGAGTIITGESGDAFKLPWQAGAYLFAKNVYEPKILSRAQTLTVTA